LPLSRLELAQRRYDLMFGGLLDDAVNFEELGRDIDRTRVKVGLGPTQNGGLVPLLQLLGEAVVARWSSASFWSAIFPGAE
jgi:hypothetical protein